LLSFCNPRHHRLSPLLTEDTVFSSEGNHALRQFSRSKASSFMNINQQRQQVKKHAMMEAARALERLGIDQSQPIDIFRVIQDESIWLMFQPLKNLYGFYIRQGKTSGIGIHSGHPLKLQRYTAAHEYAHHVLKHVISFDDMTYIERGFASSNLDELAADTFASYFLMPLQLVNNLLKKMGLLRIERPLTAVEIYQLSLDLGASYKATVSHLSTLKIVAQQEADTLRKVSLKEIKAQLQSQPLENSWAEVWALDKTDNGKTLHLRAYDDLKISLPENPTTGYVWMFDETVVEGAGLSAETEPKLLSQVSDLQQSLFGVAPVQETFYPLALIDTDFEINAVQGEKKRFGNGGNRYFTVRTLLPGIHTLRLRERRSWEEETEAIDEWAVSLKVLPKITGNSNQGFVAWQKGAVASTILSGSEAA